MSWRLAKSLERLRKQVDQFAPARSKASDGTKGDDAHAARESDHNPNAAGVVTAIDFTHDPKRGFDAGAFAEALIAARDPRVKYIIWNRRICSSTEQAWQWRPYRGRNPHTMHVHLSVKGVASRYDDDAAPWPMPAKLGDAAPAAEAPAPAVEQPRPTLRRGSTGQAVRELQQLIGVAVDGVFGQQTEAVVKGRQRKAKLPADGIVGPYTWAALRGAGS